MTSPVNVTGPLPNGWLGLEPAMNDEGEKTRFPIRVSAVTLPMVPPLKSPGAPKSDGKARMLSAGTTQVAPWLHANSTSAMDVGAAEWRLNDGPEIKKLSKSFPKVAVPVNVKLSARAEPMNKQTIVRDRMAGLNDGVLMEPPERAANCYGLAPGFVAPCFRPNQSGVLGIILDQHKPNLLATDQNCL
jgi:hypothetical protein